MKVLKTKFREFDNYLLANLPVIVALIMICCAPFFLLQDEQEIANQIAGYAYYLLVVGILWKAIQYIMNKNQPEDDTNVEKFKMQS